MHLVAQTPELSARALVIYGGVLWNPGRTPVPPAASHDGYNAFCPKAGSSRLSLSQQPQRFLERTALDGANHARRVARHIEPNIAANL